MGIIRGRMSRCKNLTLHNLGNVIERDRMGAHMEKNYSIKKSLLICSRGPEHINHIQGEGVQLDCVLL
jgi:hypothetical protein